MRKWMFVALACIVLCLALVYILIPNIINIKRKITVKATRSGISRVLPDKNNAVKWWPGQISNDSFYFNDFIFSINKGNITTLPISISGQNTKIATSLLLIPLTKDSTQLEWMGAVATSYNPIKRFLIYQKTRKIETSIGAILQKMEIFYSKPENIYGFEIKKELVTDSLLIATSGTCAGFPTNQFIYSFIDKLKNYIIQNSAKETGYPMLNIGTLDSINFEVKVAIPTDKLLPSSGNILQKRMPGRGNILVTEVKGGTSIAAVAFEQIKKYADDYERHAPAIPFYSLITDRLKEPDTAKWVTKIYFPVM
jgi:hypothetical protein